MEKRSYSTSISKFHIEPEIIRQDYELQYNKDHIVEKVLVGETDRVKEVNSHFDEVGLVNVMKMALARGEDPLTKFNKTEDGVMFGIDPNMTKDDLISELSEISVKKSELAKTLGISLADFDAALANGTINDFIKAANIPESSGDDKKGDEE